MNRLLAVAGVKLRSRLVVQRKLFRVAHDSHDGSDPVLFPEQLDLFSDRILVGPEFSRHCLVDDQRRRRVSPVPIVKKTTANKRDLRGGEKAAIRDVENHLGLATSHPRKMRLVVCRSDVGRTVPFLG